MTVASMLLSIARKVRPLYYGAATSAGTTTTLVDNTRIDSNDYFNNGIIFFLTGTLAGRTASITDYNSATFTFTFPAQSAAPGSGANYAAVDKKYSRGAMIDAINSALIEIGPFIQTNQTLTTVEDQEQYTLPAGVSKVLRVEIARNTASPYEWEQPNRHWVERDGSLFFDDDHLPTRAGRPIRIYYECAHDRVSADTDTITSEIDEELVASLAAVHVVKNRVMLAGSSDPEPAQLLQALTGQYMLLRAQRPKRTMQRDTHWPAAVPPSEIW